MQKLFKQIQNAEIFPVVRSKGKDTKFSDAEMAYNQACIYRHTAYRVKSGSCRRMLSLGSSGTVRGRVCPLDITNVMKYTTVVSYT